MSIVHASKLPFYSVLSCCISNTKRLPCITTSQIFCGLPLLLWSPSPTIISLFFYLSLSILSICPNHLHLPLCMQFLMLTNLRQSLSSSVDFLSFSRTLHIHCTIIMSFLSSFAKFSSFTTIENWHIPRKFYLIYAMKTPWSKGKISLNFFQPQLFSNNSNGLCGSSAQLIKMSRSSLQMLCLMKKRRKLLN